MAEAKKNPRKTQNRKVTLEELMFKEGSDARYLDTPRDECPYIGSARQDWLEGWDRTDEQYPKARAAAE
jgi:hypothetical protein